MNLRLSMLMACWPIVISWVIFICFQLHNADFPTGLKIVFYCILYVVMVVTVLVYEEYFGDPK